MHSEMGVRYHLKHLINEGWISLNMAINFLKPEHIEALKLLEKMRNANFKDRLRLMQVCGLYRQTGRGTLSLVIASMLGKI